MNTVLVTGGCGHIGSRLIRELANREDVRKVIIYDNMSCERYCSLFNLPENIEYEFIQGDISDKENLNKAMKNCDVVIHLAAITNAPESFEIKDKVEQVNFKGTENVVDCAIENKVEKLIYPSTTSVYGPVDGLAKENCKEEDLKPQSPYAETKLKGERIVLEKAKQNNLNATVFRFGTIFGTSPGMRFHTAVNKFCFLASNNLPLTVWDKAQEQKRPYLDLQDAIRAIFFAIDNEKTKNELFNVVTKNLTVNDMVNTIREFIPDLRITITQSPLLNQQSYVTEDTKIRDLGFSYVGDLRKAIGETIKLLNAR